MTLHGLNTLAEQHQFLSGVDRLRSESKVSAANVEPLEHQFPVRSAELASARVDMTGLEKSVTVVPRYLDDSRSV